MQNITYRSTLIVVISFAIFAFGMFFFGVDMLSSLLISLVFSVFLAVSMYLLVVKDIMGLDAKLKKLEHNAEDYSVGTKLLIRRDLELNRANEKLQEFDEIKSNFISVVAHQLRTPLSGVKWTLNMILNGDMGELNNDQKTFLMKSYESNGRMITLVNDMLATDRIQSGKVHYGFRFINIVDLLDNVLFEMAPQASKKNISIEFKNKLENLPQVFVDPETMRAVLQNLLENSIKYTMDGGRIELDVQNKGETLEVSIADNGIGIPDEEKKKVFGRFFRATNAIKQETDGSGLGLYIAKTIIEKNGGKIWFDSEVGKGTTFHFTVPTKDDSLITGASAIDVPVQDMKALTSSQNEAAAIKTT